VEVPGNPDEVKEELHNVENKISELQQKKEIAKYSITSEKQSALDKIEEWYQEELEKLQLQRQKERDEVIEITTKNQDDLQKLFEERNNPLLEQKLTLKNRLENISKSIALHEKVKESRESLDVLEKEKAEYEESLQGLDSLKDELLQKLPITGLEIRDDKIFKDDILFENLNTAEQIKLVVEICKLHSDNGFMVVDGIERLDSENFKAFAKAAEDSNIQMIVTQVTEDPVLVISNEKVA
jgi:hypothetical protein